MAGQYADTTSEVGQQRFNLLETTSAVPAPPSNREDINGIYIWSGFESQTGPNGQGMIIQAEILYLGSTNEWYIQSQFGEVLTSGGQVTYVTSTPKVTYAGYDTLQAMWITEGSGSTGGQGDQWFVSSEDTTQAIASGMYIYTGQCTSGDDVCGDNYAFNQVIGGDLEAEGIVACDGLPASTGVYFSLEDIDQEATGSSGWDTYENVKSYMSWNATPTAGTTPPNCSYSSEEGSGAVGLFWTP
jgi:hypothetical protein